MMSVMVPTLVWTVPKIMVFWSWRVDGIHYVSGVPLISLLWKRQISEDITHSSYAWSPQLLLATFDLEGRPYFLQGRWNCTWLCQWRGKWGVWLRFLWRDVGCFPFSIGITEKLQIFYFGDKPCRRPSSFLFSFSPLPSVFYYQPPFWILLILKRWYIFLKFNLVSSWWWFLLRHL